MLQIRNHHQFVIPSHTVVNVLKCFLDLFQSEALVILSMMDKDWGTLVEYTRLREMRVKPRITEDPSKGLVIFQSHSKSHHSPLGKSCNAKLPRIP
jgi:hypothetical protein